MHVDTHTKKQLNLGMKQTFTSKYWERHIHLDMVNKTNIQSNTTNKLSKHLSLSHTYILTVVVCRVSLLSVMSSCQNGVCLTVAHLFFAVTSRVTNKILTNLPHYCSETSIATVEPTNHCPESDMIGPVFLRFFLPPTFVVSNW